MRKTDGAGILCRGRRCRSCADNWKRKRLDDHMAQPNSNKISEKQHCAGRFLFVRARKKRADSVHAPRFDVGDAHRLSAMGGAVQRARLERVLCSFTVSLLARSTWLLERRARDYGGPDP